MKTLFYFDYSIFLVGWLIPKEQVTLIQKVDTSDKIGKYILYALYYQSYILATVYGLSFDVCTYVCTFIFPVSLSSVSNERIVYRHNT